MPLPTANSPLLSPSGGTLPNPASQLPDLPPGPSLDHVRGPVQIPPFETWQIALMIAAGILVLALLIWGIVAIARTRKPRSKSPSPYDAAILELGAAAAESDDEQFAIRVSHALRAYFENARGIPALGRSTPEFLQSIDLPENQRTRLDHFLNTCDRAKFAKLTLPEATRIQLIDTAKKVIQPHASGAASSTGKETQA